MAPAPKRTAEPEVETPPEPPPDEAARNASVDNPGFHWESGQLCLINF